MAPTTSRHAHRVVALGPLDRLPADLHPRERSLQMCEGLIIFVRCIQSAMEKGEVCRLKNKRVDLACYLKRHAERLVNLCSRWMDDGLEDVSPVDWAEVAREHARFVSRQITLMIEGLCRQPRANERIVARSGEMMIQDIRLLTQILGQLDTTHWSQGNKYSVLGCGDGIKIYLRSRPQKLPEICFDMIPSYVSGSRQAIVPICEDCIDFFMTCEQITWRLQKNPTVLHCKYVKELTFLGYFLYKVQVLLQVLLDKGRPTWWDDDHDDERHPHQYYHTLYRRIQDIIFRLQIIKAMSKIIVEEAADFVKEGELTARKRLIHLFCRVTGLVKVLLKLHHDIPSATDFGNEETMQENDESLTVYRSTVEIHRYLDTPQLTKLQEAMIALEYARFRLVGCFNENLGV